jgi:hypothetical protein
MSSFGCSDVALPLGRALSAKEHFPQGNPSVRTVALAENTPEGGFPCTWKADLSDP